MNTIINKFVERIYIDYPEKDKIYMDLKQFSEEIQRFDIYNMKSFLNWMNSQPKDYFNGEFLYKIKEHHKSLKQNELFDYWLNNIYK